MQKINVELADVKIILIVLSVYFLLTLIQSLSKVPRFCVKKKNKKLNLKFSFKKYT